MAIGNDVPQRRKIKISYFTGENVSPSLGEFSAGLLRLLTLIDN